MNNIKSILLINGAWGMNQETQQVKQEGLRFARYLKGSVAEFKKVVWPKRADAMQMTGFVIMFVAIFAAFIFGVDSVISLLFNLIIVKG